MVVNRCAKTEVTRKRVARTAEGVNRILVESKGDLGVTCSAESQMSKLLLMLEYRN